WCLLASFCTSEMDSTPPATKMSSSPARMRCAASATVCRPEEQKRFTVMPEVVTGRPARSAIWRAILPPVAPSGVAQPMITSSISFGSSLARSTAALTAWPPMVAPWVMLRAPRQLLHSGVLAVETITASAIEFSPFLGKFDEQGRGLPDLSHVALAEFFDRGKHLGQAHGVGVEHRPAAVGREAVAGQVDHVDVGSAQRDAFLEDVGGLVDERVDQPFDDFLVGNRAGLDLVFSSIFLNYFFNIRIRNRFPVGQVVLVPALAGLLPVAAELGHLVADLGIDEVRPLDVAALADLPADVQARHVA